jgi:GAF domain-containing protein
LRLENGGEAAVLLVADERAVLRTLCTVAVRRDGAQATEMLQRAVMSAHGIQDLVRPPGRTGARAKYRFPRSSSKILGALAEAHPSHPAWLVPGEVWLPLRPAGQVSGSRIACAILLKSADPGRVASEDDQECVVDDAASIEIAEMVSCTVQADVRRDAITTAILDEGVDFSGIALDETGFAAAAQQLVDLAVTVSSSQVAALYMTAGDGQDVSLVTVSGAGANTTAPPRLEADGSTAKLSLQRNRAVQYPSTPVGRPVLATFAASGQRGWSELATPVLGPAVDVHLPPAGVLLVARQAPDAGEVLHPYSSYDHSVLRNVAMRLTLIRSATDMEEVARTYRRLARASTEKTVEIGPEPSSGYEDRPLPADLLTAMSQIKQRLAHIAEATASHSATLRSVIPDAGEPGPGLCLVRIAAHPQERTGDPGAVLHRADGGLNWRAVISGRSEYCPVVQHDEDYFEARRNTRSELVIPLRIQERVIGTVNLESPHEHAYDTRRESVSMMATQVGLAISDARLELARTLEALAIEVVTRRHDFAADARRITSLAKRLPEGKTRDDLSTIARAISKRARHLRAPVSRLPPRDGTLPSLFEKARLAVSVKFNEVAQHGGVWSVHDGEAGIAVYECLRHMLANVKDHASTEAGVQPSAMFSQDTWGGLQHDLLQITHRVDPNKLPSPNWAVNLYRVPLPVSDGPGKTPGGKVRPRFGAYLAGIQARRLGGDAWLTVIDPSTVRITLTVPSANPAISQ